MEEQNNEKIEIDQKKLRRMINRIYYLERVNTKTAVLGEKEIKEKIQDIIEEEVKKCF